MGELDDMLKHSGVKGMKWGIRKDHIASKTKSKWDNEHVKLTNYKGKTYFISEHNMNGKTLTPRVPQNYFTKNGYEDDTTNRVSFAPSVRQALMGLSQNVTGKKFYVHEPDGKYDIYKPSDKAVPDAKVTGELWVKDPVKLKNVGEILATGDAGKPGERFKYGDHEAELYEFNYEWDKKHSDKLDDILEHSGVKGMKWGVIRGKNGHGEDHIVNDEKIRRTKLGQKLDSLKRERQWHKILKDVDKLSTSDITSVARRISLENDLKVLSKSKIGTAKDKQDYLRRAKMDNDELSRKIVRLRAKEKLHKSVNDASKEQREFGIKLVQIGGSLGYKYAINKKLRPKDIFDTVRNPKTSSDDAKRDIQKLVLDKLAKSSNKT